MIPFIGGGVGEFFAGGDGPTSQQSRADNTGGNAGGISFGALPSRSSADLVPWIAAGVAALALVVAMRK